MRVNRLILPLIGMIFACMLAAATSHAAPVSVDPATLAALDAAAQEAIRDHRTAGLAVGVMSKGQMIFAKGYGNADLENIAPVTPDTVFRVASVTKQFTASAILLLAERRKLSVDDKLSKFLPQFPRGGDITIRQLLTHTAGIKEVTEIPEFYSRDSKLDYTTAELVDYISRLKPLFDFEPGTGYSYSNTGYFLLGAVIEKVSGRSIAEFYNAELFQKVGMNRTAVDMSLEIVPNRAAGYDVSPASPVRFQHTKYISYTLPGAAGSMRSTVGDLAKWHRALFKGQVLQPSSLKMMTTPARLANGKLASTAQGGPPSPAAAASSKAAAPAASPPAEDYGFGIKISRTNGHYRLAHGGGIYGFQSALDTFPDDELTIVVLANTTGATGGNEVAKAIRDVVVTRVFPPARAAAAKPAKVIPKKTK